MDRTEEFLAYYSSTVNSDEGDDRRKLQRRHKKERFAVEDLSRGDSGDAVVAPVTPSRTFFSEASSVLASVSQAGWLLERTGALASGIAELQAIIDLCLERAVSLQNLAETMAKERRVAAVGRRGWLARLTVVEECQLDQHEAAIVWFVNHRISLLSRKFETMRAGEEKRREGEERVREIRRTALAGTRPSVTVQKIAQSQDVAPSEAEFAKQFGVHPDQMLALVQENNALVQEYMDMHNQIATTHASLSEIARLQTTLQEQLLYQASQVDRLFDEASSTVEKVRKANSHLLHANRRQPASVRFFLWFIFFASVFVLTLHWICS